MKRKNQKLSKEALVLIANRFKVMSDVTRLQILQCLMEGEKNVGQIQVIVQSSQPNISKHLYLMIQEGLLMKRKEGVSVYYSILDDTVYHLCESVCVGLQDQLEATIKNLNKRN